MSRETIWETFLLKKAFFLIDFVISATFFPLWAKQNRQGLSKLHSACPEEKCEDFLLKKGWFFISFCTLIKIIVDFCQTVTAGFPKHQSTCPEKNFERKKNEKRWFLRNFVIWVKKLGNWANKIMQGLPKVHSACPGELLEEKNLVEEEWFLSTSHALREKLSSFEQKKSWTFGKKFAVCFSELHSSCPEDVFEEKHIWKWWFSCAFCALSESFWSIGGKLFFLFNKQFTIGFSKPKFTCPGKQIENFFGKSFGFSSFSVLWPKYFWFLGKNFFQGVLKLHRPVQMEALRIFFENNLEFLWFLHLERKTFGPLQNI